VIEIAFLIIIGYYIAAALALLEAVSVAVRARHAR
jgi:hypothetical protein